jgi:hypothetical protein
MRTWTFYFLSILTLIFLSCRRDDDPINTIAGPQIEIEEPSNGATVQAGRSFNFNAKVTHNNELSTAELRLPWEIVSFDIAGNQNVNIGATIDVPEDAELGAIDVPFVVTDALGNSTEETFSINIIEFDPNAITFRVTVPENTPEEDNLYIMLINGANGNDPANEDYRLSRDTDGVYTLVASFEEQDQISYRVTRGSFETEEVNEDGSEITRVYVIGSSEENIESIEVQAWKDLINGDNGDNGNGDNGNGDNGNGDNGNGGSGGPGIGDGNDNGNGNDHPETIGSTVTFHVTVPGNTPEEDDVYIVGNFNGHQHNDENYRMTRNQDGTFTGSITRTEGMPNTITYNFSRGPGNTYEKDANGETITRTHTFGEDPEEKHYNIIKWADNPGM